MFTVPTNPIPTQTLHALSRLIRRPNAEGVRSWRMSSSAVREDDWHVIEHDVDDGWTVDLAPFGGDASRLRRYASDARDLALAMVYLREYGNSSDSSDAGAALRRMRKLSGLSRREAAQRSGCPHRFLRAVERGELPAPPLFYARVAAACATRLQRDALAAQS